MRTDEDELIDYDFDELAHAYAMIIDRSQGSECPAALIPITTSAWMMLQRNLPCTAITRAKTRLARRLPARPSQPRAEGGGPGVEQSRPTPRYRQRRARSGVSGDEVHHLPGGVHGVIGVPLVEPAE